MPQQISSPALRGSQAGPFCFLEEHLNVHWLRPESALWDAIASSVIASVRFDSPSLDLGCGNGIFSFITAGGSFSPEFDWYRNVDVKGFWTHGDVYDCLRAPFEPAWIVRKPEASFDGALDGKPNLLRQAEALGFYRWVAASNANHGLPFQEESFQTIFSNMLYWLNSAEASLKEVWRILRWGGRAFLCLPDPKLKEYCMSYHWRESGSPILHLLNRGRSESIRWTISQSELGRLSHSLRFKMVSHHSYLSPLTLRVWDIGLRPLFPVLIRMVEKMSEANRRSIKSDWIDTIRPFLKELVELDGRSKALGGYHFVCLEKESCR